MSAGHAEVVEMFNISDKLPESHAQSRIDDSSESSEDDEDLVKQLYSNLPEDLGFTLVGMNFGESDFRTLRRLKMDLDTFLALSEKELLDLGVKQCRKLQEFASRDASTSVEFAKNNTLFWKPTIKELKLSSDEAIEMIREMLLEVREIRRFLEGFIFSMSIDPPENYTFGNNTTSQQIWEITALQAIVLGQCLQQQLGKLRRELKSEEESEKVIVKDPETDPASEITEMESINTNVRLVGKLKSSKSYFSFCNVTCFVTTTAALLVVMWKMRKVINK